MTQGALITAISLLLVLASGTSWGYRDYFTLEQKAQLAKVQTVLVEVRDSGTGVKDPDRIFDAFFTTKENGMGMGLAICRSIIDAHHGRLWAVSGQGAGTTFSFTLPVQAGVAS